MSHIDDNADTLDDFQTWCKGADLQEGSHIDRYQILGLIGKGGMGAVYKAYDSELERSIAIKILTVVPQQGQAASKPHARLMREAQALARLSHPNVVSVFDVGTFEEGVYIAMEYVKGKTLRAWLSATTPTQKEIIHVLSNAGKGLQAAHEEGIVHRDFKPDNVLVGDKGQVKVVDFGLARASEFEDAVTAHEEVTSLLDPTVGEKLLSTPITKAGARIGTTVYMAPEHFLSQELDEKTDQFSFCVTFFEALYGRRPFPENSALDFEQHIISGTTKIPTDATVPKWIEEIILKGLSVSKADRHASISELLDALKNDPEIAKSQKRKKQLLLVAFVLASVLVLFVGTILFSRTYELCSGADRKVLDIWNHENKTKIRSSFAGTGLSYATDTFDRVATRIDDYTTKWKNEYTEACEATRVRGEQSEEIMDLRMGCLHKHLLNTQALTLVFAEADKTVVEKAIQAVSSLSGFSNCNDLELLQSRIPLAKDKKTRNQVRSIREKMARVKALCRTGKYRKGLELVQDLNQEAKMSGYQPVQAEVLVQFGELLEKIGEYNEAEMILYDAARVAGESKYALVAAQALVGLVRVVGYQQARHDAGISIARAAEVMIAVTGVENVELRSRILNNLGILFLRKGDYDKALDHVRNARNVYEKAFGRDHLHIATSLNHLGGVFLLRGDFDKALEHHRQALAIREKELGPEHPYVAYSLNNIGDVLQEQGKHDSALEYLQKSVKILEKALGSGHPILATPLITIGIVFLYKGMPLNALAPLEQAVDLCTKKTCQQVQQGVSLFSLAQALVAIRGDRKRAIKLPKQSHEVFLQNPKAFSKKLEEVDAWLKKHNRLIH